MMTWMSTLGSNFTADQKATIAKVAAREFMRYFGPGGAAGRATPLTEAQAKQLGDQAADTLDNAKCQTFIPLPTDFTLLVKQMACVANWIAKLDPTTQVSLFNDMKGRAQGVRVDAGALILAE